MTGPWFISQFQAQLIYWYGSEGYNIYGQLMHSLMLGHSSVLRLSSSVYKQSCQCLWVVVVSCPKVLCQINHSIGMMV